MIHGYQPKNKNGNPKNTPKGDTAGRRGLRIQQELEQQLKKLVRIKPPMRVLVSELPKETETDENTIYILQQEWIVMDGKLVRLS